MYFAAYKNHIGLYPTHSGIDEFKEELSKYKTGIGSTQFPIDKPMLYELISGIVKARVNENIKRLEGKMGRRNNFIKVRYL